MQSVKVSGNTAVIYSSSLNQPASTVEGRSSFTCLPEPGHWDDQTGTVTSSSPGSVTIHFTNNGAYTTPTAGNKFYLFGSFKALDTSGEWYRDPTSGKLYLWAPNSGNPASQDVEAQAGRLYAFNLNNVHDITINGVTMSSPRPSRPQAGDSERRGDQPA